MKKLTLVVIVLLVSLSVFAGQRTELTFKPYALGHFTDAEGNSVNSKYGFGGSVSLLHSLTNTECVVGGEASVSEFFCGDAQYYIGGLQGKVGIDAKLSQTNNAFCYAKVGFASFLHDTVFEIKPMIGCQAGVSMVVGDTTSVLFGAEADFLFPGFVFDAMIGVKHGI